MLYVMATRFGSPSLAEADEFDGPAEVILSVDGVKHTRHVQVQCGATSSEKTILFASA